MNKLIAFGADPPLFFCIQLGRRRSLAAMLAMCAGCPDFTAIKALPSHSHAG